MAGLYVHVPFCRSKCIYCDFYSTPHTGRMEDYVNALIAEWQLRKHELNGDSVETLYLGGGTPSLLPPELLARLLAALPLQAVTECTVEVNPDDVTRDYIKALVDCGVNRVSMGVQSFDDNDLRVINRRHTARQALRAVDDCVDGGITNVTIDLIYGLPGQTLEAWHANIEQAFALPIKHLSAYNLTYEHGTRLWVMREKGAINEVDDDTCIAMHELLCDLAAQAGWEHYEISNFALPSFHARHNSSYWDGTPYLGLGAAAHSYDGTTRSANCAHLNRYLELIAQGKTACERETLTLAERHDEDVMLRLRTARGLDTTLLQQRYGERAARLFTAKAKPFVEQKLVAQHDTTFTLTRAGIMLSDHIISSLLWD